MSARIHQAALGDRGRMVLPKIQNRWRRERSSLLCLVICWLAVPSLLGGQAVTVLHQFAGSDGVSPSGQLAVDASGNVFGTTEGDGGSTSEGTAFEMIPSPSGYSLITIYKFGSYAGDAIRPSGLVRDAAGNLYGVGDGGANGAGCIFKLQPAPSGFTAGAAMNFSGTAR